MIGDESTVGELELFYTSLEAYAINQIHVENLIEKYWVANLADTFVLIRNYNDIPTHN